MARLTLYSRAYCHLCADMHAAVLALHDAYRFDLTVLDVDADPMLVARYDELVPVLEADGRELCRYHFDEAKVREYLSRFR
jgi:hypothetical protein